MRAGLQTYLDQLGFNLVGYGCTTCIGNSGPLPQEVSDAVAKNDLVVASVLSAEQEFRGAHQFGGARELPDVSAAGGGVCAGGGDDRYALRPHRHGGRKDRCILKDIWPTQKEVDEVVRRVITSEMFRESYATVLDGDARWRGLKVPAGATYAWDAKSTYIQDPPYFEGMTPEPKPVAAIKGARVLARFGNSITTDHISPAGSIKKDSAGGQVSDGARSAACGFQLLRLASRQP